MSVLSKIASSNEIQNIKQDWTEEGLIIDYDYGHTLIKAARETREEDLSKFHTWAVWRDNTAESEIFEVKSKRGGGSTIGYIFPIQSLDPESPYCCHNLEGKFKKIFSSVATISVLHTSIADPFLSLQFIQQLPQEISIRDLYRPDCSIVVLGVENISRNHEDQESIKLLLQEFGHFLSPPEDVIKYVPFRYSNPATSNRTILPISHPVIEMSERLRTIISIASQQKYSGAAFLMYYQAIELFLEHVYRDRLRSLFRQDPSQIDPRALQKKVRSAVGESERLKELIAICEKHDAAAVNKMKDRGIRFLSHLELYDSDPQNASAAKIFRSVRNIVIHRQIQFSPTGTQLLAECTHSLHEIVFLLIKHFSVVEARPENASTLNGDDDSDTFFPKHLRSLKSSIKTFLNRLLNE